MIQAHFHHIQSSQRQATPLRLVPGQIFHGHILKIFPNQTATVSIKGMNVTAHLEAALAVGERYWFEVQEGSGIPRLKVLEPPQSRTGNSSHIDELRLQLGLSNSKKIHALLQRFLDEQVLITRRSVGEGIALLERVNAFHQKGIDVLIQMVQRGLPISEEVFLSLQAVKEEPSLTAVLNKLVEQLDRHPNQKTNELQSLLTKVLHHDKETTLTSISRLITLFAEADEKSEIGQAAKQLLIRLGLIQEGLSKADALSLLQKNEILSRSGNVQVTNIHDTVMNRFNEMQMELRTPEERSVLSQILGNDPFSGKHIRTVLQMLGYQHEFDVGRFIQGEITKDAVVFDRFKSLLLEAKQLDLHENVKQQVNQTLYRVTGQQLLSQEQAGFQQLLVQLPLVLGTFQTDMTIQWEGKKESDGKLDPDYCRILFYLTLERLNEVIVDVQIQNRIVTISIFNEMEKRDDLISTFLPLLKQNLAKYDYQLLSLKWEKMNSVQKTKQKTKNPYLQQMSYKGVDIRI